MTQTDLRTWDAWHGTHQPFELGWWRENLPKGHCEDPGFTEMWDEYKAFIRPRGHVVDVGCGPRPPFAPHCTVIEPLADDYRRLPSVRPEWWRGVTIHARPAENRVLDLQGDTIVCWNALDHAIGWRAILDNMLAYGAPGARFAISTDFWPPFDGHPGFDRGDFEREIVQRFNVLESRDRNGSDRWRALSLILEVKA